MKSIKQYIPKNIKYFLKKYFFKYNSEGKRLYKSNETERSVLQGYFIKHKKSIFKGDVPERYKAIASLVSGLKILEVGSADGTLSLLLSETKQRVYALELMPSHHAMAIELKEAWSKLGKDVSRCELLNLDILEAQHLLQQVDTIVMCRLVYHLRSEIGPFFSAIQNSKVENVVMVGNKGRENAWRTFGDSGDPLGKYAFYATQEGMETLLTEYGFSIVTSLSSTEKMDAIVIGSRKI